MRAYLEKDRLRAEREEAERAAWEGARPKAGPRVEEGSSTPLTPPGDRPRWRPAQNSPQHDHRRRPRTRSPISPAVQAAAQSSSCPAALPQPPPPPPPPPEGRVKLPFAEFKNRVPRFDLSLWEKVPMGRVGTKVLLLEQSGGQQSHPGAGRPDSRSRVGTVQAILGPAPVRGRDCHSQQIWDRAATGGRLVQTTAAG